MSKVYTIAKTEYLTAVRSKAFVIGVLLTPLMIGISVGMQKLAAKKADIRDQRFAVVDASGKMFPVLAEKAKFRNEKLIFHSATQFKPKFLPELYDAAGKEAQAVELELSERVRKGELFAFVTIAADIVEVPAPSPDDGKTPSPQAPPREGVSYYTQTPTAAELPDWIVATVNDEVRRQRLAQAGVDAELVARLSVPSGFKQLGLAKAAEGGGVVKAKVENRAIGFMIPIGAMVLMYMLVMGSSPALLNTVLEEKLQRISELLISSVTPFQLMLGKLLGTIAVALTLSGLYVGAVLFVAVELGFVNHIPTSLLVWFFVFLILAMFMYGSVFAAMGAACSELRDAQNLMGPAMLILMLPMFCIAPVLSSPNGSFSAWISMFPTATPMLMLMRLGAAPGPPGWQVAVALGLTVASALACVWAGGKIFRIGILSHGQPPTIKKLIVWVFSRT